MSSNVTVNTEQAHETLTAIIKAGLTGMLTGSPGIGKSDLVKHLAKVFNLKLIDVRLAQCDPTDLLGFPCVADVPITYVGEDGEPVEATQKKASYVPMDTFPIKGDKLPVDDDGKEMEGWLIFLDEFNSADRSVQKAAYKLVLDNMVGQMHLHDRVVKICAGNLDTDMAIVEDMSSALQSRLIHLELSLDSEAWLNWAAAAGIDHRVSSFIRFKPGNLSTFDPQRVAETKTYACPRTWEFASKLLKQLDIKSSLALPILAGTLSEGVAREFLAFCRIYQDLPSLSEMLAAPDMLAVPTEPGTLFAVTGSIAQNATEDNVAKLIIYMNRFPMEFQVVCLREMGRRHNTLLKTPAVAGWVAANNTELF